jgi:hypothetical protein
MTTFGMYGGKKFQDKQREELLSLLDAMIHGDEAGTVTMAGTVLFFYERMSQFKDRLDFHNQCLLANIRYQSDKIFMRLCLKKGEHKKIILEKVGERNMAYYKLRWTERKGEKDYEAGFGIGPRFHPTFRNAKVVVETERLITFEKVILDSGIVAEQVHHLKSWDGYFGIEEEKVDGNKDKKHK